MERGVFVTLKAGWLQWKLAPVTSNTGFLLSIGYGVAFWDIDAQKIDSITVLLLPHYFISFLFLAHITLTWQDSDVCPMFARHSLKFDSTFGCLPGYFEDLATKRKACGDGVYCMYRLSTKATHSSIFCLHYTVILDWRRMFIFETQGRNIESHETSTCFVDALLGTELLYLPILLRWG